MVVTAAAVVLVRPFVDRMLGREAAPGEEQAAGF
jgi:hypothetical protein